MLGDGDSGLLEVVVELSWQLLRRIDELDEKIDRLNRKIRTSAREHEETARLMTIPGIGPIIALVLEAFVPPMESFRRERDFSAWLGAAKPREDNRRILGDQDHWMFEAHLDELSTSLV